MTFRTARTQPAKIRLPSPVVRLEPDAGTAGADRPRGHYVGGGVSELLDLLRALAAMVVVLLHARLHTIGPLPAVRAESGATVALLVSVFSGWGDFAVTVFFVLSGYLIGGQVLNAPRTDGRFWTTYAVNRFSRLSIVTVPAVLLSAAAAHASMALWGVSYTAGTQGCLPGVWDVTANLLYLHKVAVRPICSDGPIWSIANEAFYYALFPLLLLALRGATPRARMFAATGAALLVAYALYERFGESGMLAYFGVWMIGAAAAYPLGRGRRGLVLALAVLCLAVASVALGTAPTIHLDYPLAALVGVGLLAARWWGAPGWVRRPRVKRAAQGVAAFSFSLYLFHMPAMNFARGAFGVPAPTGEVTAKTLTLFASFVLLSYAAGYAGWWVFERHTLKLRGVVSRVVARLRPQTEQAGAVRGVALPG